MHTWLRRVRGAIGMGLAWGAAWGAAGSIPRWVFGFNPDAPFPIIFGVLGFVAGVTFSGLLVLTEGRRRFDQMSLPRFAAWGAAGGLLLAIEKDDGVDRPRAAVARKRMGTVAHDLAVRPAVAALVRDSRPVLRKERP